MGIGDSSIQVQVRDLDNPEDSEVATIPEDGYICVCAGRRYLAGEQRFANGTVVLTLKLGDGAS